MSVEGQLAQGLVRLALSMPQGAPEQLLRYLRLLQKWNRVYNLTAIREPQKLVTHHLLDSLSVLPYWRSATLIDVGSGAGLPGIPLAIACPDRQVVLLESNYKKGAFLRQATIELRLANVRVQIERAEDWHPATGFELAISRAFSDLAGFVEVARHLVSPTGLLAAMKGVYPHEELAQLPASAVVEQIVVLEVPELKAARHLVLIRCTSKEGS
jgi:16S rRNA (guanine527-N7)-methyltransferase